MKKLIAKMRKLKRTRWGNLTFGEKVLKVVIFLVKIAIIVALLAAAASAIAGIIVGLVMINVLAGGFFDASCAYRHGDRYIWYW